MLSGCVNPSLSVVQSVVAVATAPGLTTAPNEQSVVAVATAPGLTTAPNGQSVGAVATAPTTATYGQRRSPVLVLKLAS